MGAGTGGPLRLRYDIEVSGEEKRQTLPFVVGIIADLSGKPTKSRPPWNDRRFRDVDRDGLAALMEEFGADPSREPWSGIEFLAREFDSGEDVKVRVLDTSREELSAMFEKYGGDAWDQSPLFCETYERTYGIFRGEPYSLLIADYRLAETEADALIRRELEKIGEAAAVPLLRPTEGCPADGVYSFAAEIGRAYRSEGWYGGLAKPAWADAAGLDFEAVHRLLCCGPFVHLIKSVVRDRLGEFKSPEDMEKWLNLCLGQYVAPGPAEVSVNRPLLGAELRLTDSPEFPGAFFNTQISVRPAYRLEDPGPEQVLETRLPGIRPV